MSKFEQGGPQQGAGKSGQHPMEQLKEKLSLITRSIPRGSEIIYIDYPVHSNGGDILIMKGTEAFFKAYGIRVRARYSVLDFPDELNVPPDVILVLHGGGNFGDLYAKHQLLRERIVERYPGHRIVMLPQTIFYKSELNFGRTAAILNRHRDVHLYVRDSISYEMARKKFKNVQVFLSPDMAHQLYPIAQPESPQGSTLFFLRTDIEKTPMQERLESQSGAQSASLDWTSLYTPMERKALVLMMKLYRLPGARKPMQRIWYQYSQYLVDKAIREFSRYESIVTSRLHGHILSCLMDKPNVLLDNSYGKNTSYYTAWSSGVPGAELSAGEVAN
ncbi:polysaccharide pyruvyl transferase family protein [Paenibacillus pasadenensis]|uniref:polysaccharide pyruvyl transferase family protein n=1 Tax=Paenibacillus pasadenensis TaxID=217090 RepID=UPI00203D2C08|nr:polysaccharide pyruvyl transferase family protein [Paenibacillus pasadenensis]MCM3748270.1 polysaccharide pyruvyl transferase family protein [Paenibacillus pasadenensis]